MGTPVSRSLEWRAFPSLSPRHTRAQPRPTPPYGCSVPNLLPGAGASISQWRARWAPGDPVPAYGGSIPVTAVTWGRRPRRPGHLKPGSPKSGLLCQCLHCETLAVGSFGFMFFPPHRELCGTRLGAGLGFRPPRCPLLWGLGWFASRPLPQIPAPGPACSPACPAPTHPGPLPARH